MREQQEVAKMKNQLQNFAEQQVAAERKVNQGEVNKKKLEGDLLALKAEKVKIEGDLKVKEEELKKKSAENVTVEEAKLKIQ
jgi:chromosome segregation ATPase